MKSRSLGPIDDACCGKPGRAQQTSVPSAVGFISLVVVALSGSPGAIADEPPNARLANVAAQQTDIGALVSRGNERAFQKRYAEAEADFKAALALQPDHLGALVGLAHALAWSGQHADAMAQFERALTVAPENIDAQRGAGFTELWRGNPAGAITRFERILAKAPEDTSAREGLVQARAARAGKRPRYELATWFGRSALSNGPSDTGLRLAEVAVWPNEQLRLFARYDDGLSRDNAALVNSGANAALTSAGGYLRWAQRLGTLVEYGTRKLPGGVRQRIYRIEQSFFLDGGYQAKVGGWRGPRNDNRTESLVYAGVGILLTDYWRLEPTVFYSRTGVAGESERRLLLATVYDFRNGWEIGAGAAGGRTHVSGSDHNTREGFFRVSNRVQPWLQLHLLARRELGSDGDSITVTSIGATFNWR